MARPTIIDIAKHAGVSFKTVSRVLNHHPQVGEEYRLKVEQAIAELKFKPNRVAQLLRGGRSYMLGLLTAQRREIDDLDEANRLPSYIADIITGMLQACQSSGFHLVTEGIDSHNEEAGRAWLAACFDDVSFDGVVLMPPLCDLSWLLDDLTERGVNFARMNPGTQLGRGLCLVIDNHATGYEIGQMILAQGHRRIGYITGPVAHLAHAPRLDGLRAAVAQVAGAALVVRDGAFTYDSGLTAGRALLDLGEPPTAIFASNDEMAAGVLAAAFERGLAVPADLSIVGFGGLMVSQSTWPRITTVSQPTIAMARMAGHALIAAAGLGQTIPDETVCIAYDVRRRQSLGSVAAGAGVASKPRKTGISA